MTPEQLEFKIFLDSYLLAMKAEHKRFMKQMRNRFICGALIVVAIYVASELLVKALLK